MGSPTIEARGVKMYDRRRSAVDVVNELASCLIPVQLTSRLNFEFPLRRESFQCMQVGSHSQKPLSMFGYNVRQRLVLHGSQDVIQDHESHLIPTIPCPRSQLTSQIGRLVRTQYPYEVVG